MRRWTRAAASALSLMLCPFAAGPARALDQPGHPIGMAAWEIDGVAVERREDRLHGGPMTPLPTVQLGDRVTHVVRAVGQTDDLAIQMSFDSPGYAYVLGSATGGSCDAPAEVAPGLFQQACVIAVGGDGSGNLFVTYEVTADSDNDCVDPANEPDVLPMGVTEPVRAPSDVVVCVGGSAPAPSAPTLPDTAMQVESAHANRPSAIIGIGIGAVLLLAGSVVLLPQRR